MKRTVNPIGRSARPVQCARRTCFHPRSAAGNMEGIPATGNSISQPAISLFRLANGKIVEAWYASDSLSMMQQLGVIPAPQAA